MQTVGVRELANRASALLDQVQEDTDQPIVVTKHGRPVAVLSAIDPEAYYDFVLEQAPAFSAARAEAEAEIKAGDRGRPMADVFADLDAEDAAGTV